MADVSKEQVVDFLSKLSVMDIAALTKELEDKWGVKAAPVAVAAAAGAAAALSGYFSSYSLTMSLVMLSTTMTGPTGIMEETRRKKVPM